jgi:hypothetical protein
MTSKIVARSAECNTFAGNQLQQKTHWNFLWGFLPQNPINPNRYRKNGEWIEKTCPSEALSYVHARTNFAYLLISVSTLGLAVPQKIEWCCTPLDIPTEN